MRDRRDGGLISTQLYRGYLVTIVLVLSIVAGANVGLATAQTEITSQLTPALVSRLAQAAAALGPHELDQALLPATRDDALPDGYVPPDLVSVAAAGIPQRGGASIRSVVI